MTVSVDQWSVGGVMVSLGTPVNLNFPVHAATEVSVTLPDGSLALLNVDYTVALNPPSYASAVVNPLAGLVAKAAGSPVYIDRATLARQPLGLPANTKLPEPLIERALDRIVMRLQELSGGVADALSRAVRVPRGKTLSELRGPLGDRLLGFDSQERPIAVGYPAVRIESGPVTFSTRFAMAASFLPAAVMFAATAGYAAAGDLGAVKTYVRVSSPPAHAFSVRTADRFLPNGTIDNANGGYWTVADSVIRAEMGGLLGDGSDETAGVQALANLAVSGKTAVFTRGKTYGVSAVSFPAGAQIVAKGATFAKVAASATYALTINDFVVYDQIKVTTPGGGDDRGVRIAGDFVDGGLLTVTALTDSTTFGVTATGTALDPLTGVSIQRMRVKGYSSQVQVYYTDGFYCPGIIMQRYTTGLYVRDNKNANYGYVEGSEIHPSATGGAGNNTVLIESISSDRATDNVTFGRIVCRDSGEHAVRIGGAFTCRDVRIKSLSAYNTGSLPTSTGGAAFKVLLDASNPGMHEGIFVDNLYFEDCTNSTAVLVNQTAVQVHRVRGGYVNNIVGRKRNNAYSCRFGIQVSSCDGFTFDNPDIIDVERSALNVLVGVGLPPNCKDVVIRGGRLANAAYGAGVGAPVALFEPGAGVFDNVSIRGTVLEEGRCAARWEVPTTGNYINCVLEGEYKHGSGDTGGAGAMEGQADKVLMNIKSPIYGTMVAKNGSIWQDTTNDLVKVRKAGAWTTL